MSILSRPAVKTAARVLLFVYVGLVICPIQYWTFAAYPDSTWYFAVNYAAAHHLIVGRDYAFTSGPLAYLAIPEDVGDNLIKGLVFQAMLWMFGIGLLWKLFFRSRFPLRNLAIFSICFGFSGQLYQYPEPLGPSDLLLTYALILLVLFHLRGGITRYITALVLVSMIPLIKFVGFLYLGAIVTGIIIYRIIDRQRGKFHEIFLAIVVTGPMTLIGLWMCVGSLGTLASYLRSSIELSSGYSLAMSLPGSPAEIVAALETLALVAAAFWLVARCDSRAALFLACLFAILLFVSFKHGFVRQDSHIAAYFCLAAIILSLAALAAPLYRPRALAGFLIILLVFATIWQDNVARNAFRVAVAAVTGVRTAVVVWPALRFQHLRQILHGKALQAFPPDARIEPEIKSIIGERSVASLSPSYNGAYLDGLNLRLYPIIERYSAYTPYLDQWNAQWVQEHGPQFLLFDGSAIDDRQPWMETPAMWSEVYRWYDLRLLGKHNLLLERRVSPRFQSLEPFGSAKVGIEQPFAVPRSSQPIFWSMHCKLSSMGKLRAVLFRVPPITITVTEESGMVSTFRALPPVLVSPSLANHLPGDLAQFSAVFRTDHSPGFAVSQLVVGGPGALAYESQCDVEWLRAVPESASSTFRDSQRPDRPLLARDHYKAHEIL